MSLIIQGLFVGALNTVLMFALEYGLSSDDVKRLRERDGGKELHIAGIRASIFNSMFLGAITYYVTIKYCCLSGPLTLLQQISSIFKFLLIENLWYYCAHFLMHRRSFYWMHRFHHKVRIAFKISSIHCEMVLTNQCGLSAVQCNRSTQLGVCCVRSRVFASIHGTISTWCLGRIM